MDDIQIKIQTFKKDLMDNTKSNLDIVREHITFGTPYVFQNCEKNYYDLKKEIGDFLEVNPSDIIMVGSAKLGFSIAPYKIWREIQDDSDIDMVIISKELFDKFWKELFEFNIKIRARNEKEDLLYRDFLGYFFKGWIRPDKFPFGYKSKIEWFKFFKGISYKKYDKRGVTGAIFRDVYFFEQYHINNISNLRTGGYL